MIYTIRRLLAFNTLRLIAIPFFIVGMTTTFAYFLHVRGEQVVADQLRERLLSSISIAALNIDAENIERVQTLEDQNSTTYRELVQQLRQIRKLIPHVRFAYIMRRTSNPLELAFVADADALSSVEELDVNKNGRVDSDEEAGLPGDVYPIADMPVLQDEAFQRPVVEKEMHVDQWGNLLSAYAPVFNAKGEVIAIIGIDMEADTFLEMTQNTFSMIAVTLATLVGVLIAIYILYVVHTRHLDSLRQLDTERTALLDLATHQLGMPLATFRWWFELLKERDHGAFCKNGEVCDQLQEGIDRLDAIIMSLHQAAKLQESTYENTYGSSALPVVTKEVIADLQKQVQTKKQKVRTTFGARLPLVSIDQKLCAGIMRELIENASAYSPNNSTIRIAAHEVFNGVEVRVSDNGYGIPPEDIPAIFSQFKRGSNATKYRPYGNGLGLYIVRRIIERSRGKIRVESTLGKGTTFILFLPSI